jgi:hypothetical protein
MSRAPSFRSRRLDGRTPPRETAATDLVLERQARTLLWLTLSCVLLIGCALVFGSTRGGLWSGWSAAVGFAAALAASASLVVAQGRRRPAPIAGLAVGLAAFVVVVGLGLLLVDLEDLLLPIADHVIDLAARAAARFGISAERTRQRLESIFGQRTGLLFFLGNAAVVTGYAVQRVFVFGFLARLGRIGFVARIRQRMVERIRRTVPSEVWTNRFFAIFTGTVLVCGWGLMTAIAFWAAWRGGSTLRPDLPIGLERMPWSATFVVMIELAAAFHPTRVHLVVTPAARPAPPDPDPGRIAALYDALEATDFRSAVGLSPDEAAAARDDETAAADAGHDDDPDGEPTDPRIEAVLGVLERRLRGPDLDTERAAAMRRLTPCLKRFYTPLARDSAVLLFGDTVTTDHYHLFTEFALTAVDEGGVTLVLCPDGQARHVLGEIERVIEEADAGLAAATLCLGRPAVENRRYDLLVASETTLEHELLGRTAARRSELDRLALIIGIDMHLTDLPRVGMMLRRLREEVDFDEVRMVFTLTDVRHPSHLVRRIFLDGKTRPVADVRLGARSPRDLYRFALADTEENRARLRTLPKRLDPEASPLPDDVEDAAALIAILALRLDLPVVFHDPRGRRLSESASTDRIPAVGVSEAGPSDTWSPTTLATVEKCLPAGELIRFRAVAARRSLPTDRLLPADPDRRPSPFGRVVIVEEAHNADAALTRPYDFLDPFPTLVVVLLKDLVPTTDAEALEQNGRAGPILVAVPEPSIGAREITYILEPRLDTGVRETDLRRLLDAVPARVKEQYAFAANRAGLLRMVRHNRPNRPSRTTPDLHDPQTNEPMFTIETPPGASGLTGRITVHTNAGTETHRLVLNDVGLRFVTGAFTALRRPFDQVESIAADEISVGPTTVCSFEKRQRARLALAYDFDPSSGFVLERDRECREWRSRGSKTVMASIAAIASGPIRRHADHWYEETETEPPLYPDGGPKVPRILVGPQDAAVLSVTRTMRLLHLVWVLQGDVAVAAAGKRVGEPEAAEPVAVDRPDGAHDDAVGAAAMAAVVLIKEGIATCFPGQAHRVAVFSPQAKARLARETGADARYFAGRYALASTVGGPPPWCDDPDPWIAAILSGSGASRIDLFVIEDSEWSLGIVETLLSPDAEVYRYLRRMIDSMPTFGAERPPSYFGPGPLRGFVEAWMPRERS